MEGFTFHPKSRVEICGRQYEVDVLDAGYLEGLMELYWKLGDISQQYSAARSRLLSENCSAGQVEQIGEDMVETGKELVRSTTRFLTMALGRDACRDILKGRRLNAGECLQLCAHVMNAASGSHDPEEEDHAGKDHH